ncbi:hypothetical protein GCM10010329_62200 [Streptomyces spiroverticillatus]|uniref:DUF6286 domain-containing protein n=1 Tax=Streptomyces finlayi TaxID=67296 RepID=A0A918X5Y9_9ACTN|nr:DUF6286 domain-containing protein [Streptomyces finlayi]GHA30473.1 hypothetical protein GCM10010329_62200 [Streptomyces spiroverticillatus]GHD14799.1 hypothetical protein GCM10010334_74230 [Streptomyces finlayi]
MTTTPPAPARLPAAERGSTTVTDRAVSRIAARAWAEELPRGDAALPSATVVRTGRTASVTLGVTLPYAADLAGTAERLRQHVARTTAALTGLTVPPPEVRVRALAGSGPATGGRLGRTRTGAGTHACATDAPRTADASAGPPEPAPAPARRPWSPRLGTALLVLGVGTAACAYLLAEGVARRTGHVLPGAPRPDVLHRVATTSLADPTTLVAGIAAVVLGLWLLGAAVLPGRRDRLPMTVRTTGTRATLDRSAIALLLRDEALAVPGVTSARVRVGRRRATVRALAGYGELDAVQHQLTASTGSALETLGVTRPPRPRVRLRAAPHRSEEAGA